MMAHPYHHDRIMHETIAKAFEQTKAQMSVTLAFVYYILIDQLKHSHKEVVKWVQYSLIGGDSEWIVSFCIVI